MKKKMFIFEWQNYRKKGIFDATCIICTDSTFGSEFLQLNIEGKNLKDIIIRQDKAGIEIEARIQIPIIQLKKTSQMVSIVMVGDCDLLRPLQISKRAQIRKFILQSSYSLYEKLFHNFPSIQLLVQYFIHPDICSWVNKRIYNNWLQNGDSIPN